MSMMEINTIKQQFRIFFWIAIPLIVFAVIVTALDLLLRLGWGYSYTGLYISVSVLVLAIVIRTVGLWIITNID